MDGSWWRVLTKCGPPEKGMTNPLQYSCLENTMNSMKRQNDGTLKEELCRSVGAQYAIHRVLKAGILKWFAIPFSSGPHFVRTLHHDPSALGGPTWHGS